MVGTVSFVLVDYNLTIIFVCECSGFIDEFHMTHMNWVKIGAYSYHFFITI